MGTFFNDKSQSPAREEKGMKKATGIAALILFVCGLLLGAAGCSTENYSKRDKNYDSSSNRDGSGY